MRARGAALAAVAWLSLGASAARAAEAKGSFDLDGDGTAETVLARGSGSRADLTVESASGRRLGRVRVPSPASGTEAVAVSAGSLGSAGALLEVETFGGGETCRSIWRLRESALDRVPLRAGAAEIPACDREGWSVSWEVPDGAAMSVYRRTRESNVDERTLATRQVFQWTGFALEIDPARGSATLDGMTIPRWPPAEMFPLDTLPRIHEAFDFGPVRAAPRLFLETEPDAGTFRARWKDAAGELVLPVRSSSRESGLLRLDASEGDTAATLQVVVRNGLPVEATVLGLGKRFDRVYVAVTRRQTDRVMLYPTADEDIAREILPGTWSGLAGGRVVIESASGGPARVAMDGQTYRVSMRDAPSGTDVALIPAEGSGPAWALDLRTPVGFVRAPAQCAAEAAGAAERCRTTGPPGELFKRVGARVNY
jgi:hypothetical protein